MRATCRYTSARGLARVTGSSWRRLLTRRLETVTVGMLVIEDRFVIVDNGQEVRTAVVSPQTTIATANLRRK